MSLDHVLRQFPDSKFRAKVRDLASDDPKRRLKVNDWTYTVDKSSDWYELRKPSWFVSEAEAHALLLAAETLAFPLPENDWQDGLEHVLSLLWRSPHPSLAAQIPAAYARQTSDRRRLSLLSLLGAIGTRDAAVAFMRCVRENGWPGTTYGRLFEELEKLIPHHDIMLPDVVLSAGKLSADVGAAVLGALASGAVKADAVAAGLEALAPFVLKRLRNALTSTRRRQGKPGIAWRFQEAYFRPRFEAGLLLDLAGRMRDIKLLPLLKEACGFTDPKLVMFAALALLRRGQRVPAKVFSLVAASHESRAILWHELAGIGKQDCFPEKWRTWEAFGAARMTEWLLYPAELGCEPDELELVHTEWLDKRKRLAMFVWKFRTGKKPWFAGVSGPHELRGEPGPLAGHLTFSRFEPWDSATPQEHLERSAGTAGEILEQARRVP